jgi:TPR repeat protein
MYEHGEGVEHSYERAIEYYEQAAHLGDAKAQFNLVSCMPMDKVSQKMN